VLFEAILNWGFEMLVRDLRGRKEAILEVSMKKKKTSKAINIPWAD